MHRRHGRQLIGVDPGIWPVDRLPVVERGVDHAVTGQEAGRRDRDQLDEQGAGGKQHNRGAHLPVPAPMADEQPDQAADQHGEVQHRVIEVERLDQQRVRQEHPLDRRFARQGDRPLEMPDPLRPAHRPQRRGVREAAGELGHPAPSRPGRPLACYRGERRQHERAQRSDRSLAPCHLETQHGHPSPPGCCPHARRSGTQPGAAAAPGAAETGTARPWPHCGIGLRRHQADVNRLPFENV